jgi:valyl-tRNA synthetase
MVSPAEKVERCTKCGGTEIEQDADVLDTWFSSGLWPFSTLGWPEGTEDLCYFYPSSVMETGYDILFFWVARMIFFGIEFMGEVPFPYVYLHGTVRDAAGQRMSKTKGNVIDPTELTAEFGSDALRFTLITAGAPGADIKLDVGRVAANRNFANKIWHTTRYVLRAIDAASVPTAVDGSILPPEPAAMSLADRWIISRTETVIEEVTWLLENFQLGEAGRRLHSFLWSEYADWYIESTKVALKGDEAPQATARQTLAYVLERSLRLLHPYMPFVTEDLWQHLPHAGESIMVSPWPVADHSRIDEDAVREFEFLMGAIRLVRNARAVAGVEPALWIPAIVFPGSHRETFLSAEGTFSFLARVAVNRLEYRAEGAEPPEKAVVLVVDDAVIYLPLAEMMDHEAELARLRSEIAQVEVEIARTGALLANQNFVSRAPEEIVNRHRERLSGAEERLAILQNRLAEIGG